jgi:murein biosynthesis integral membrane protein MurJ
MMIDVKRIVQATAVVSGITLVVKGLGFVEKLLLAYFFGTGFQLDAYLVAFSLPFSAYIVLREVVKPAFLPTFLRIRQESEEGAWRLFNGVGTLLLGLLSAATVAAVVLAAQLVSLAAPGFSGAQRTLAVHLTQLVMPALVLLGMSTLTTSVLHSEKRFIRPALGDAAFRAGPLVLLLATGGVWGMALGVSLGALSKLLVEAFGLKEYLRRVRLALDLAFEPVRAVGRLAAPLLAALFLSLFIVPLVENSFASRAGVGGVSALAYARKVVETLATILPYTLGLVLLPFSAEMAARQDEEALSRTLGGAVRALTLLFVPVTLGLAVLREPFVQLLFERGAFTAASTQLTAGPLLFYAFALLPFALEVVVVQFFFAVRDTLTPVLTDVAAFVLNVALIPFLMAAFGLGGIALAAAIAKALKVLLLLMLFRRRIPAFRLGSLVPFTGQIALVSLIATIALLAFSTVIWPLVTGLGMAGLVAYLCAGALVAAGTFFLAAYLLRVSEVRNLWQWGRQRFLARHK